MMKKEKYITPLIEVIEMEIEGVIAQSGTPTPPSVNTGTNRSSTRSYNSASSSDLEDMISDILQVGD